MAKDPAFLFYPADWVTGTMGMTFEEKGAYMELLMMQFSRGHMTTRMVGQTVGQIWDGVKEKFVKDANGCWYNRRLEEEKEKRQLFTQSRLNNIKGLNQHTKNKVGHTSSRMVNVNINENISIDKEDKTVIQWESIKQNFFNDFRWKEKFCREKGILPDPLQNLLHEFISNIELKEDYKDLKELKRHFTNTFNKNKNGNRTNQTRANGAQQLLELARQDHARRK